MQLYPPNQAQVFSPLHPPTYPLAFHFLSSDAVRRLWQASASDPRDSSSQILPFSNPMQLKHRGEGHWRRLPYFLRGVSPC